MGSIENINKENKEKNIKTVNLIERVKSKYIIIEIFSYLEQILKLKMIKYNNKYQNIFEINIDNYKKKSKIKRIMEKNGFGKEYTIDSNKLIFEGEFKNGKKNGKGKEYYESNGKILFEGIYLNGKRHGKGIKFTSYGEIEFKGEYSNGYKIEGKGYNCNGKLEFVLKRNGKGKEYDYNGKLIFEGEFKNEMKNGKGKKYYKNGKLQFDGEYKDDQLNGKVKEYNNKGNLIFEGEYKDGYKWKGKADEGDYSGILTGYFKGEYLNGKKWNGKAKEYRDIHIGPGCTHFESLIEFEGEYINGKRKGKGEKYDYKNRRKYEIQFNEENDNANPDDYD